MGGTTPNVDPPEVGLLGAIFKVAIASPGQSQDSRSAGMQGEMGRNRIGKAGQACTPGSSESQEKASGKEADRETN